MSIVELPPLIHDMSPPEPQISVCTVQLGMGRRLKNAKTGEIFIKTFSETTVSDTHANALSDLHAVITAEYNNNHIQHLSKYSQDGNHYGFGSVGSVNGILHSDYPELRMVRKTPILDTEEKDEKIRQESDAFTLKTFLTERRCHQMINERFPGVDDDGRRIHVLKLFDTFVDHELMPNMVFPRAHGSLLAMFTEWQSYPTLVQQPMVRLGWLRQILQGLITLHRDCGLIHGDLKSSNILMFQDGKDIRLSICDLGTAIQVGTPDAHQSSYQVTRWYRPPEVTFLLKEYTTALDMFSLACVYLEMVHDNTKKEHFLHTDCYVQHITTLMYLLAPQIERHPEIYPYYLSRMSCEKMAERFRDLCAKYRSINKDAGECHAWDRCMFAIERQSIPLTEFEKHLIYNWLELDPRKRMSAVSALAKVDEMLVYLKQLSSMDPRPPPPVQSAQTPPATPPDHTAGDQKPCRSG